jgi:release factor glutamine methyltransferase
MTQIELVSGLTVKKLLQDAERQLRSFETARLDAEILFCHSTGLDRSAMYSHPEKIISNDLVLTFKALIDRRLAGQPIAYITVKKEFWSIELHVDQNTLIPRPETESLIDAALDHIPSNQLLHIADLGTGCGCIAIAIATERPACHITATDISVDALWVAQTNAQKLGINNISFIKSDWYSAIQDSFDLIISNPPYIRDGDKHLNQGDVLHEPRIALSGGYDGFQSINQIVSASPDYIKQNGWLLIEHGYDQGEFSRLLFDEYQFTDIETRYDYDGHERLTCGRYLHV